MEAPDVFACLHRAVLCHILGQGKHKAFAPVHYIDTLALCLGEAVRRPHGITRKASAQRQEHDTEKAYLLE